MIPLEKWEQLDVEITACRLCPRLVEWREQVARVKRRAFLSEEYWSRGVPGFGDHLGRILVVGLAPGAHGSNRTGRMFTGDASGDFLYPALHRAGFASHPQSSAQEDGLELKDVFITAVNRCAPPDNKPTPEEMKTCRPYLLRELDLLKNVEGLVALGRIAFDNILQIIGPENNSEGKPVFGHGSYFQLGRGKPWLLCSYHPSRQNTQTGRLTPAMFDAVWAAAREKLST
ncbi:MAG: uracil-DNA glycosylase [Anaerolineaceae bacterium]